jgi:hypothetical protein
MTNGTAPRPCPGFTFRDLGDELLFLGADGDAIHVLNDVARAVYFLCDGSRDGAAIASALCAEYDVAPEVAASDVARTLDDLARAGLIIV